MGLVGEALFGKVLDNDINVQIEKTKQHFFFYDVRLSHFQFVWLSFLLSPSSPPGFFCALANEATGGQFFSGSRVKQCRTESEVEAEGKKRRNERERKSRRDHPPHPHPRPCLPFPVIPPPESITQATLLTLGRPTLLWSINVHPAP